MRWWWGWACGPGRKLSIWVFCLLHDPPGRGVFLLEKEIHVHCADAIKFPSACTPGFVGVINWITEHLSQELSSLLMELTVAKIQLLHLVIALQRDKCADTMRSSSRLQPAATPRPPHEDKTEGYQAHWNLLCMGDHQHRDWGSACPKTKLCQACNITVIIFPKQQKRWDFVLCRLLSHSSHLACSTSCSSVPAPVSLPPLDPDQEHFLVSRQGLASAQLLMVLSDADGFEIGTNQRSQASSFYWRIAKWYEVGLLMLLEKFLSPRCHSVALLHSPEGLFLS